MGSENTYDGNTTRRRRHSHNRGAYKPQPQIAGNRQRMPIARPTPRPDPDADQFVVVSGSRGTGNAASTTRRWLTPASAGWYTPATRPRSRPHKSCSTLAQGGDSGGLERTGQPEIEAPSDPVPTRAPRPSASGWPWTIQLESCERPRAAPQRHFPRQGRLAVHDRAELGSRNRWTAAASTTAVSPCRVMMNGGPPNAPAPFRDARKVLEAALEQTPSVAGVDQPDAAGIAGG